MTPTHPYFAVTGISRSGTSLMVALLNQLPHVVCFNEVLPHHPDDLPDAFHTTRDALLQHKPVPNKYLNNTLTTDTLVDGVEKQKHIIPITCPNQLIIGSKRNLSYLNHLPNLIHLHYPIIAMIRDPLYTIASWGSPRALKAGIPGARILDHDLHPHLQHITFHSNDPIARRAQLWEHYASILHTHRHHLHIVHYETLCAQPTHVLHTLATHLNTTPSTLSVDFVSTTRNTRQRYAQNMDALQHAIHAHCPTQTEFGYGM